MTDKTTIGRILLKDARLAFPKLFEPEQIQGQGDPKFGSSLIIPPDHPQVAAIKAAMQAVAKAKWGEKAAGIYNGLSKQDRLALHDGDTKTKYDGFPGNLFISATAQENSPPTVVDQARNPLGARSGKPYAGCFVNASLEFWAQDNKFGQRVNCTLRGVQFLRDGDAFSAGRPADADEFEEVTEGAGAEDFA
jgi:hypothetical protein